MPGVMVVLGLVAFPVLPVPVFVVVSREPFPYSRYIFPLSFAVSVFEPQVCAPSIRPLFSVSVVGFFILAVSPRMVRVVAFETLV